MQTRSLGGAYYFMLFTDDCTRFSSVYFLSKKSQAFGENTNRKKDKDSPLGPRGRIQVRRAHELLQVAWDYAAIHSATHSTTKWSSGTEE